MNNSRIPPWEETRATALADELVRQGVMTIFCITGAGNLAMVDACARAGIDFVFSHHEQASVMGAIGFAQVTGQVGVAMVTTGGGAANAVTGVLSAHLDSIPLLIIAGNESDFHIEGMKTLRAYGVQGFDSVSVIRPIAKAAVRVVSGHSVEELISESFELAASDRPGPVFIEFPMNLQRQPLGSLGTGGHVERPNFPITRARGEVRLSDIEMLSLAIQNSSRPLMYLGNGVRRNGALETLLTIAEGLGVAILLSWSAIDLIYEKHPLLLGRAGIYGDRFSNIALQNCDFLLAVGTRLSIPQVGYDRNDFARNADRWVIDIDEAELSKFEKAEWRTIHSDSLVFASALRENLAPFSASFRSESWLDSLKLLKEDFPRAKQVGKPVSSGFVHSFDVVDGLADLLPHDAIIVTDVGAGLLTGHYGFRVKAGQRLFTSQGLGEMGFGLPGAIGAQIAAPERLVVCLNTDGGIMFNLQELQVISTHQLAIKIFIFNNSGYGMIRSSQDNLFNRNRVGSAVGEDLSFPHFGKLAEAFGFGFCQIDSKLSVKKDLPAILETNSPEIIEVCMDPEQLYLPRLATSKREDGTFASPSIEHLTPEIGPIELTDRLRRAGLSIEIPN